MLFIITVSIITVLILSLVSFFQMRKKRKYLDAVERMNDKAKQREIIKLAKNKESYRTNHLLHFLLTFFCVGFWVIPWFIIAQSNASQRDKIDSLINSI